MSHSYFQLPAGRVMCIDGDCAFPRLEDALTEPNGLIAIGGKLTTNRLLDAYRLGIFPWFSADEPIMWWSPNPRMVLFPDELKISTSLKKTLNNHAFETRMNTGFQAVINACSNTPRPNQSGTWITPEIINAYTELHQQGHAICSECWQDNQLVGGCYGVIIGKMFYGESMFHTQTNASKIAFVKLVKYLEKQGVGLIDCQMKTPLLTSFGGREIPRKEFAERLAKLVN
ncbi:MAG: leucyl/phenylalanyl-tRNA--protein transferase [Methylophilaceae bacterium]